MLFRSADKLVYMRIPTAREDRAIAGDPVVAGRHYLRLRLVEMYLKKRVEWFQSWYPAVHSLVRFDFGSKRIEVPFIADAARLALDGAGAEDVITRNFMLTPAVPFNGGTVDLDAGLMTMRGANYIGDFVKVLSNFARVLAVPQLSAVLTVAEPLASGIQDLFGSTGQQLHLGLHQSFSAEDLVPGYFAVLRTAERAVDVSRLWVRDDQLRCGPSILDNAPFQDCDYMLLRLETFEDRDDWEHLTDIYTPFQNARRALADFAEDKARFYVRMAILRALEAPELTTADRRRVAAALKDRYEFEKTTFGELGLVGDDLPDLGQIMQRAMPVERALERGEVSYMEVLADA